MNEEKDYIETEASNQHRTERNTKRNENEGPNSVGRFGDFSPIFQEKSFRM